MGGRSQSDFAKMCGLPESSLRSYLEGKSLPGLEKLIDISRATGASIDWMAFGRGSQNNAETQATTVQIPRLFAHASAGSGSFEIDGVTEREPVNLPVSILTKLSVKSADARVLSASGSSMEPTIGDGDLMLVDTAASRRDPVVEGRIYVLNVGNALFVKRLRRSTKGWIMVSDNRAIFGDEPSPAGDPVHIHGQVVWAGRQLP